MPDYNIVELEIRELNGYFQVGYAVPGRFIVMRTRTSRFHAALTVHSLNKTDWGRKGRVWEPKNV